MAYLPHSDHTLHQSISTFAVFHYPTASVDQVMALIQAATFSYQKHRGWLSYVNSDIDEEAFAKALLAMHGRAWYIELPYRAGVCTSTRLLKRVTSAHSTGPRRTHSLYQAQPVTPSGMATLTVPAHQVPFIKQQLEVMALMQE